MLFQHVITQKMTNGIFYIPFFSHTLCSKSSVYNTSQFGQVIFQVLTSHTWLGAMLDDSTDLGQTLLPQLFSKCVCHTNVHLLDSEVFGNNLSYRCLIYEHF